MFTFVIAPFILRVEDYLAAPLQACQQESELLMSGGCFLVECIWPKNCFSSSASIIDCYLFLFVAFQEHQGPPQTPIE